MEGIDAIILIIVGILAYAIGNVRGYVTATHEHTEQYNGLLASARSSDREASEIFEAQEEELALLRSMLGIDVTEMEQRIATARGKAMQAVKDADKFVPNPTDTASSGCWDPSQVENIAVIEDISAELDAGRAAAIALVEHLENMGGAFKCEIPLVYNDLAYLVTAEACGKSCGFVEPYGWVPEHGCPLHDK